MILIGLTHQPAFWGFLGAFIYAAPKLVACVLGYQEMGASSWPCVAEFVIALAIGAIAAAAFGAAAMNLTHLRDMNAMAATIGLVANPLAPRMIMVSSNIIATAISSKLGKALQGEDKP